MLLTVFPKMQVLDLGSCQAIDMEHMPFFHKLTQLTSLVLTCPDLSGNYGKALAGLTGARLSYF